MKPIMEIDGVKVLIREWHNEAAVYCVDFDGETFLAGEICGERFEAYTSLERMVGRAPKDDAIRAIVSHFRTHRNDVMANRTIVHEPFHKLRKRHDLPPWQERQPIRARLEVSEIARVRSLTRELA